MTTRWRHTQCISAAPETALVLLEQSLASKLSPESFSWIWNHLCLYAEDQRFVANTGLPSNRAHWTSHNLPMAHAVITSSPIATDSADQSDHRHLFKATVISRYHGNPHHWQFWSISLDSSLTLIGERGQLKGSHRAPNIYDNPSTKSKTYYRKAN